MNQKSVKVFGQEIPIYSPGTGGIWDPLGQAFAWLYSQLTSYFNPLVGFVENIKFTLWQFTNNFAFQLQNALKNVMDSVVQGITGTADKMLTQVFEKVFKVPSEYAERFAIEYKAATDPLFKIIYTIKNSLDKALENLMKFMLDFKGRMDLFKPESIASTSLLLLTGVTGISFGIHTMLSLLQTKVLGCGLDLSPIRDFVSQLVDVSKIGGEIIRTIVDFAFATPLSYYINYAFKMRLPSFSQIFQMFLRGLETEERVKTVLRYEGYSEEFVEKLWQSSFRLPSLQTAFKWWRKGIINKQEYERYARAEGWKDQEIQRWTEDLFYDESPYDLLRMADFVTIDEAWARRKLRNVGMDDESINIWLKMLKLRPIRQEQFAVAQILRDLVASGYLTLDEYEKTLKAFEFKSEEVELRKWVAELLYNKNILKLKVNSLIYLYRKNVLTEKQLLEELVKAGMDKLMAFHVTQLEAARKGLPLEPAE